MYIINFSQVEKEGVCTEARKIRFNVCRIWIHTNFPTRLPPTRAYPTTCTHTHIHPRTHTRTFTLSHSYTPLTNTLARVLHAAHAHKRTHTHIHTHTYSQGLGGGASFNSKGGDQSFDQFAQVPLYSDN